MLGDFLLRWQRVGESRLFYTYTDLELLVIYIFKGQRKTLFDISTGSFL
jgi:hypothetical protein